MTLSLDSTSFRDKTLALALAVLGDRVRALPVEDRDDIYELTKVFFDAENDDERDSAAQALLEILDNEDTTVVELDLPGGSTSPELSEWQGRVSQKVRTLREACEMSQVELANCLGVAEAYVERLEAGELLPNGQITAKLSSVLGVSVT